MCLPYRLLRAAAPPRRWPLPRRRRWAERPADDRRPSGRPEDATPRAGLADTTSSGASAGPRARHASAVGRGENPTLHLGPGSLLRGLRYGEGQLYTRNAGERRIFWQGPSVGFDFGGRRRPHDDAGLQDAVGERPSTPLRRRRRLGLPDRRLRRNRGRRGRHRRRPIRSGLGGRLGLNIGYLEFTAEPTWNAVLGAYRPAFRPHRRCNPGPLTSKL